MNYKLLVFLIVVKICVCEDTNTVEVRTKHGVVSGKVERTFLKKEIYYSFRGIPYARPPIGKLRFKPPVAHQEWEETYEAYKNKPTCLQHSIRTRVAEPFGISGSEDCLYISIFTPNLERIAPVVVFDYTDNFRTGFNGTDTYSPDFFMEEDVIVITISHRLGLFGYLTSMDSVIPPNNGLKDFIFGLRWIQENINGFGGDPDRVTLMGSRGGAVLVDILLRTEKAKGLFNGVIIQSGTSLEATFFEKEPKMRAFEFGKLFNITTDDSVTLLEELQRLDAETLISKDVEVVDLEGLQNAQLSIFPFAPVIENSDTEDILKSLPENSEIVNDVPIMIGMNSREGLDLIMHYLFDPQSIANLNGELFFLFPIRSNYKFDQKSVIYEEAIKDILSFYLDGAFFDHNNILEYSVYVGDMLQNYALNRAAKIFSRKLKSSVYYYLFDFRGSLNENMKYLTRHTFFSVEPHGATIIDELCYLYLCTRIKRNYEELLRLLSEQHEIKVLRKMVRLWANFAKSRNPTPEEHDDVLKSFKWKPIEKGGNEANYLHITKTLQMKTNPIGNREKFWDDFLEKYSQLAVDGVVQRKDTHDEL